MSEVLTFKGVNYCVKIAFKLFFIGF